jgi:hypothetical protein
MHRDQGSNLESSRSERDVLPVPPSLCTRAPTGVAVRRRHPTTTEHVPACTHARDARVLARTGTEHLVCNLGIQGVKGQGPSTAEPVLGGNSRYGAKQKGPGVCQALGRRRGGGLPRVLSSHLPGPAERMRLGILDAGVRTRGIPARGCPLFEGPACCERADGHGKHGATQSIRSHRALQAPSRFR